MPAKSELGEFLRVRRAQVKPADVGIPDGGRRRVPGLRREEVALLAGVSLAYYVRIEQGQTGTPSPEVLGALARALLLDDDEREHLFRLSCRSQAGGSRGRQRGERLRPAVAGLVDAIDGVPAAVVGRRMDLLAWNRMGHALLLGHLPFDALAFTPRPNWARLMFLDPHLSELFVEWEEKVVDVVAYLRVQAGRHPGDDALAALVGELSMRSRRFSKLWSSHAVKDKGHGVVRLHHPVVGDLELRNETLRFPDAPDMMLATFHAEAGSPSEGALRMLATLTQPAAADHPAARR